MTRYVIVHEGEGLFVGASLGLGFFSLKECAGQNRVVTFGCEDEAVRVISHFEGLDGGFQVYPVETTAPYAEPLTLIQAGVPHHMVAPLVANERPWQEVIN